MTSEPPLLYPCEVSDDVKRLLPSEGLRWVLGWLYVSGFSFLFLVVPSLAVFLSPSCWRTGTWQLSSAVLVFLAFTMFLPMREWPLWRRLGQLWYSIFDVSSNLSHADMERLQELGAHQQMILCLHPHGIIPFQAVLWAAYCDQYLPTLYGFGAAADIVGQLPLLRNVMGWLSAGSASYGVLKAGLTQGKSLAVNRGGRNPRHLFLLPGGIAEVFSSKPRQHIIVMKDRRGLCRLSLETGAHMVPLYVFGGTDFFENLVSSDSWLSRLCRKLHCGVTIFWGQMYSPLIPFTPRITLCVADPIIVERWAKGDEPVPEDAIEELHARYLASVQALFDKFKAAAGYPDAVLEIR